MGVRYSFTLAHRCRHDRQRIGATPATRHQNRFFCAVIYRLRLDVYSPALFQVRIATPRLHCCKMASAVHCRIRHYQFLSLFLEDTLFRQDVCWGGLGAIRRHGAAHAIYGDGFDGDYLCYMSVSRPGRMR